MTRYHRLILHWRAARSSLRRLAVPAQYTVHLERRLENLDLLHTR
jgi:hypothetical protein